MENILPVVPYSTLVCKYYVILQLYGKVHIFLFETHKYENNQTTKLA